MWLMLQQPVPNDFVVATGIGATVREFAEVAFEQAGLRWQDYVRLDERYIRPTEVDALVGDPTKAHQTLGWKARTSWEELAGIMVDSDLRAIRERL